MSNLAFDHDDIIANFAAPDLAHGRGYWQKGMVQDVMIAPDGRQITARVHGTRPKPYKVTITIMSARARKFGNVTRQIFDTDCSCPVGIGCKHAAAACLAALAQQGGNKNDGAALPHHSSALHSRTQEMQQMLQTLPPDLRATFMHQFAAAQSSSPAEAWEQWLTQLTHADVTALPRDEQNDAVYYVLQPDTEQRGHYQLWPHIALVKARRLRNGNFGTTQDLSPPHVVQSAAHYITADDKTIARLMRDNNRGYGNDFELNGGDADVMDLIVRRMIATERCYLRELSGQPLRLGNPRPAQLGWRYLPDGSQEPAIIAGCDTHDLTILPTPNPWYVHHARYEIGVVQLPVSQAVAQAYIAGPAVPPKSVAKVAATMAQRALPSGIAAPKPITLARKLNIAPVPCLRFIQWQEATAAAQNPSQQTAQQMVLLHFTYDGMVVDPASAPETIQRQQGDQLIMLARDLTKEQSYIDQLAAANLVPEPTAAAAHRAGVSAQRLAYRFAETAIAPLLWRDFLDHKVPQLEADGWRITIAPDFATDFTTIEIDDADEQWSGDLKEQEGSGWWFSLDLGIMVEGQRVPLLPLLVQALHRLPQPTTAGIDSLALSGKLYVTLADGRTLSLPFARVRDMLTTLVELYDQPLNPDGSLNVPLDLAAALTKIDSATQLRWLGGKRLANLLQRLRDFSGLTAVPPPETLQATLRPYQREGLNWLQFLRDYGLGGILADDMGLGKTIQTLSHLLVEKAAGRLTAPCLIICPTSLIPNWQDEAAKFAPTLKLVALHGKDRATRFHDIDTADVVLTTYPLLPRDSEILLPPEWHSVVLDEAQAIKNPTAQATQIVCALKAKYNRLCLTGTPIENHLGEAWSHFAFLMPGMLSTHKDFNKRFRVPIEKNNDQERQAILARRLKPFVLRRHKSEVAKELPAKTEMIRHVVFEAEQRDLYETLRLAMHERVQQTVAEKGFNRSRIVILDALLKLRQVCCDPRLVKLAAAKKVKGSAKLDHLMEIVPEMIEEGRRILLFSQFTSMLDLIKPALEDADIPFVELRGDTTDRKTPVSQFQAGKVPLFLISLKAGGTGLNLTAADTVIHYDPWWNPAVENQATDRAHRIGQDKPVFVYKLIAQGTIEERILELQNRKRGLASMLLEERGDTAEAFAATDLGFLFEAAA